MDIILARSPDFDAVINQESSEGKGDSHKEGPEGASLALPDSPNVCRYVQGFLQHGCKAPTRATLYALPYSCPDFCRLLVNPLYGMANVRECCADMPRAS